MKEIYRSRIGLQIIIPMGAIFAAALVAMLLTGAWQGVIIITLVVAFVVHMFTTTYYTIDGENLFVKSGFLVNKTISIKTITKIEATNSILSAPALSFDRLEVFYGKYDSVVISPKDKAGFIKRLREINTGIIIPV